MKIVSGGQTGVDRAALDAAAECGLPRGGWCPRGRKAEDGALDRRYPLTETPSASYSERTRWNVRDSDGTLIVTAGAPTGGTALTVRAARETQRPLHVVDLDAAFSVDEVVWWIRATGIAVLNVAGPRESGAPGIYRRSSGFLRDVFTALAEGAPE